MSERIDTLLVQRGLATGRDRAKALIMAGVVYADGKRVDKAGTTVPEEAQLEVREPALPFVSRGGLKLQRAMQVFPISLTGAVAADIGASTGGFTDCMLQSGAAEVYAVDVGYGQLDWKLRNDPRVHVMERTNARFMEPAWYAAPLDFASIDVSFISLRLILPPLLACLKEGGRVVALIKPQFEAGRGQVGKNGVVRDPEVHAEVCETVIRFAEETGYDVLGLDHSPITGPKGNIEFLLYLGRGTGEAEKIDRAQIKTVVEAAHRFTAAHREDRA